MLLPAAIPTRFLPRPAIAGTARPMPTPLPFRSMKTLPNVRVDQIRQVEQNQGKVLSRISGMMLLLTLAALLASALAVSAAMAGTILERRNEVGLMKSLGASNATVASLFLTEAGFARAGRCLDWHFLPARCWPIALGKRYLARPSTSSRWCSPSSSAPHSLSRSSAASARFAKPCSLILRWCCGVTLKTVEDMER